MCLEAISTCILFDAHQLKFGTWAIWYVLTSWKAPSNAVKCERNCKVDKTSIFHLDRTKENYFYLCFLLHSTSFGMKNKALLRTVCYDDTSFIPFWIVYPGQFLSLLSPLYLLATKIASELDYYSRIGSSEKKVGQNFLPVCGFPVFTLSGLGNVANSKVAKHTNTFLLISLFSDVCACVFAICVLTSGWWFGWKFLHFRSTRRLLLFWPTCPRIKKDPFFHHINFSGPSAGERGLSRCVTCFSFSSSQGKNNHKITFLFFPHHTQHTFPSPNWE